MNKLVPRLRFNSPNLLSLRHLHLALGSVLVAGCLAAAGFSACAAPTSPTTASNKILRQEPIDRLEKAYLEHLKKTAPDLLTVKADPSRPLRISNSQCLYAGERLVWCSFDVTGTVSGVRARDGAVQPIAVAENSVSLWLWKDRR
jgi:hypothetical protein